MSSDYLHKKTDQPANYSDEIEMKFSFIDYIRILSGIIIVTLLLTKLFKGEYLLFTFTEKPVINNIEISQYWYDTYKTVPIAFTKEELSLYSSDSKLNRIVLGIKGHVFDVSGGERFYGKWGPYKKFTGRDCSNIFGYSSFDLSSLARECNSDLSNVSAIELERIDSWLRFYQKKYPEIGYIV